MERKTFPASRPVMLNTGDQLVRFDPNELSYLEADRVYCNLYMADGVTHYQVCHPMGHMEKVLDKACFVRISRSYIVNIWHIQRKMSNLLFVDGRRQALQITDSYSHALDDRFLIIGLTGQK